MKLLFLILAIVIFAVLAILAFAGGAWETALHLLALLAIGLGCLAASELPFKS
jgi:uncharacterized membrane protein